MLLAFLSVTQEGTALPGEYHSVVGNSLGEKTLIKLAGITETAAHMQEACSRSRPYMCRHPRLSRFATLAHVHIRLRVAHEIIAFLSMMDTYIQTYIHT